MTRLAWGLLAGAPFYGMGSSLKVDVGALLFAGRPVSLDERVEVPPFSSLTFPQPAHVRLDLRRVDRGLQIDGTVEALVAGECDRCLEDVVVPLTVDVEERFDPPSGTSDPFGENNVLNGTELDVGDLVRQVVTSALPFGLVCSPECRGLCDTCGRSKNAGGGCDCAATTEGDHGEPQVENPPLQDP
ncbi:MAG: hypothetical protein QOI11_2716 [Candidatus Eremiobacteraeota bacterium]|nr:hypothetical protein [Candidatus Eremiobacteraeota bacterium]